MAILFVAFILLCSFWWVLKKKRNDNKKLPPEVGGSRPLLGHLHLLRGSKHPHRVFSDLSDKYGPIFTIKLGRYRAIVVSDSETAKECFTTNDLAFSSRPDMVYIQVLGYENSNFAFVEYSDYWRDMKKTITIDILSNLRLQQFHQLRANEINTGLRNLRNFWQQHKGPSERVELDLKRWLHDVIMNYNMKIIFGKVAGYAIGDDAGEQMARWGACCAEFGALFGKFVVADLVPMLRRFDIWNDERTMKTALKKIDGILNEWLIEHKQAKDAAGGDLMHLLIKSVENSEVNLEGRDPDTVVKGTCVGLLLAASDTTTNTLTWAMAALLTHPHALKKLKEEIDGQMGRDRKVSDSDTKNMEYLNAVIKETLRLYPGAPLSVEHFSTEDCRVAGYDVPANTILITNIWRIQRDPRLWENPEEFVPERFLTKHREVDVRGQSFELMPFGSGRRMCPAISFALQIVKLTLASLLHEFDVQPCGEIVRRERVGGISSPMVTPLNVSLAPRLPPSFYNY